MADETDRIPPHEEKEVERRESAENDYEEGHQNGRSEELSEKNEDGDELQRDNDDKEKSSRRDRSRSRNRSKSKDRKRRSRSRSRERDRDRDRDRERRRRSRSRSRDRRRRSRSRDRYSRHRSRSRDRYPSYRRGPPPPRFRRRSPSPPPEDPEKEMRTVFCYQLAQKLRDQDLFDFFSAVGPVRSARIIQDRNNRRSKGAAYVEFENVDDVPKAISLTGTRLLGVPIIVTYTQAEKNRQAMLKTVTPSKPPQAVPGKISIVGMPVGIRKEDIKVVFSPFGEISDIKIDDEENGPVVIVHFSSGSNAKLASDKMDGFDFGGRKLAVTVVSEKGTLPASPAVGVPPIGLAPFGMVPVGFAPVGVGFGAPAGGVPIGIAPTGTAPVPTATSPTAVTNGDQQA